MLFFALEISQYIDELSSIMGMDRSAVVAYLVLKAIAAVYAEIAREAKQAPDEKVRIIADDAK